MWGLGIIAAFLGLVYVGRQIRLGKWTSGPWFRQFRAVRGIVGMLFLMLGIYLMTRGLVLLGLGAMAASLVMSTTVRFSGRFSSQYGPRPFSPAGVGGFSPEEVSAYRILGLTVGADRKAIIAAWKRMMKEAHPDQGGSLERAKALNAARDLLLKRR